MLVHRLSIVFISGSIMQGVIMVMHGNARDYEVVEDYKSIYVAMVKNVDYVNVDVVAVRKMSINFSVNYHNLTAMVIVGNSVY